MIKQTKLSIIVPVYNSQKHLKECVDSILAQTVKEFELILVDDGSTDNSLSICESYSKDSRVKVIHKENSGPSETRNMGLDIAKGEYIGFVDSDDFIEKNMFKTLYDKAKSDDCDVVLCNFFTIQNHHTTIIKTDLSNNIVYNEIDVKNKLLPYFFGYADTETKSYKKFWPFADYASYIFIAVYKNTIIKDNNIRFENQKEYYNEDNLFNLAVIANSGKVAHIEKPLYFYRDNDTSLTKKYNADFLNAKIRRYHYLLQYIKSNNFDDSFIRRLENKICIESINIINYYVNQSSISSKEKKEFIKKAVTNSLISSSLKKFNFHELPFSKLKIYLFFEKHQCVFILNCLSKAYNLIRK